MDHGLEAIAAHGDLAVSPQPKGHGDVTVDGRRQREALVVVRVLADDVHPSGRNGDGARGITKRLAKPGPGTLIKLMGCAHGRSIRAKSQSSASSTLSAVGNSGSVRRSRSNRQVRMPMVGRPLRNARAISERVPRPPPTATTPS